MTEPNSVSSINDVVHVEGNTLTLKLGDYVLSIKIESLEVKSGGRLRLEAGRTLFDLVLDTARTFVATFKREEFRAADLYHLAKEQHPDLNIKRNSWNAHVMSSAANHPSYHHYTSHRKYFRYRGRGKYSLESRLI